MDEIIKEYSKLLDEKSEHLSFESLATYANLKDHLSNKENKFIEDHINNCNLCEERYSQIIEEDGEIDNFQENKNPSMINFGFIKYAAAASIIIALGIVMYISLAESNNINKSSSITKMKIPVDTTKEIVEIKEKIVLAEDKIDTLIKEEMNIQNKDLFAANVVLENFIERNTRSAKNIEVLQPLNSESLNSPIEFKWKRNNYSDKIELIIVTNKNKKIFSQELDGNSYLLTETLSGGLYYWKIKINGIVEEIGKFSVE